VKFEMAKNSLFAILLRSPWWVSFGIASVIVLLVIAFLPTQYAPFAAVSAVPFLGISCYTGWQQLRAPSAAQVERTLQAVATMSWRDFAAAVEAAYRRQGYSVERLNAADVDFELHKGGGAILVSCKRWKAARVGADQLRDLHAARIAREAQDSICIATGELTDSARSYAASNRIQMVQGTALAQLLGPLPAGRTTAR
jgi:restriction system protein